MDTSMDTLSHAYPPAMLTPPRPLIFVLDATQITTTAPPSASTSPSLLTTPPAVPQSPYKETTLSHTPDGSTPPYTPIFARFFATFCASDTLLPLPPNPPSTYTLTTPDEFVGTNIVASVATENTHFFPNKKNRAESARDSARVNPNTNSTGGGVAPPSPPSMIPPSSPPSSPPTGPNLPHPHLLSSHWLHKHTHLLPSTTLLTITFSPTLPQTHWSGMETTLLTILTALQSAAKHRDNKIHLVVLKVTGSEDHMTPAAAQQLRQTESERLGALKTKANLPSSLFTVLATTTDIDVTHTSMKKLFLTVKTNAKSYYLNYARSFKKRVRALGNSPKKVNSVTGIVSDDPRVLSAAVRYCWKVGMFYEVIGGGKSGVYYQEAYGYLVQLYNVLMKGRGENVSSSLAGQCRGAAGFINFKVVKYKFDKSVTVGASRGSHSEALDSTGDSTAASTASATGADRMTNLVEGVEQYRKHMAVFCSRYRKENINGLNICDPSQFRVWCYWQKVTMARLCHDFGQEKGQVGLYTEPWRHWEAAAREVWGLISLPAPPNTTPTPIPTSTYVGDEADFERHMSVMTGPSAPGLSTLYLHLLDKALALYPPPGALPMLRDAVVTCLLLRGEFEEAGATALLAVEESPTMVTSESLALVYYRNLCARVRCAVEQRDATLASDLAATLVYSRTNRYASTSQMAALQKLIVSSPSPPSPITFVNGGGSPVSWLVTFPNICYAIAGDEVIARVSFRSHVSVEVVVRSAALMFAPFGKVDAKIGAEGVVVPARGGVEFDVVVSLPSLMVGRRSSLQPGGAMRSGATKGEKQWRAGLVRAGGGVYGEGEGVLGGVPVSCEGMTVGLGEKGSFNLNSGYLSGGNLNGANEDKAEADKQATEDYVAHSFASGKGADGPRILRVLGPMPKLQVEDLTSELTKERGVDGAVYRVVYRVTAGEMETCSGVSMECSCANSFASNEDPQIEKWHRRAMFVEPGDGGGPCLPAGWRCVGEKEGVGTEEAIGLKDLEPNGVQYVAVHLYRPSPDRATTPAVVAGSSEADRDVCKTEYEVVFSYDQVLNGGAAKKVRRRQVGAIEWGEPVSAGFSLGGAGSACFPSGIKHGSTMAKERENAPGSFEADRSGGDGGVCLVAGQEVKVRVSMSSARAATLPVRLGKVEFEGTSDSVVRVTKRGGNTLFDGEECGRLAELGVGTKVGVGYVLSAEGEGNGNLGSIKVAWAPLGLKLAAAGGGVQDVQNDGGVEVGFHGPLPGCVEGTIDFLNPHVQVQSAPFKVVFESESCAKVAVPTSIVYRLTNLTKVHQHLAVEMDDVYDGSILMDGLKAGSLHFAPGEERELCYNAVFMLPGKTKLPSVRVVSRRHNSFVIGGGFLEAEGGGASNIFVSP